MKKTIATRALFAALVSLFAAMSIASHASDTVISEQAAIEAALAEVGVELLGIRFDKPDSQWDVFVKSGKHAYEVEIDAITGKVIAAEKESLAEIRAELSGDLSHEGTKGDVDQY